MWIVQGCFLLNSTSSMNKTMCQHFGTLEQKVIAHFPSGCKKCFLNTISMLLAIVSEPYWCWHYSFISTPDTANRSTTPLFCRDVEIEIISEFVKNSITNQQPGALYICGAPGTGKTASLTHVLESLEVWPSHSCVLLQPVASCSSLPASGVKKPPLAGVTTVYLGL